MKVDIQGLLDNFTVNKELLKDLFIEDIAFAIGKNSFAFGHIELYRATITKEIEELKLEYKLWLSDKKKELDRKVYNSEMAKEEGVIAKNREKYLEYNKKIIDLTYQQNVLLGMARAYEMRANLLISIQTKEEEQKQKKIEEWNNKVEKTKI